MKKLALLLAPLLLVLTSLSGRADEYTYTGSTSDTWSDSGAWTETTTSGSSTYGYPAVSADTADIGYAGSGTQTVIYDANTTGTFGTLNFTETGTGTDLIDYQKMVGTISNSFSIGSATGTDELILDSPPRAPTATGYSTTLNLGGGGTGGSTLTVASGGLLILRGTVSTSSNTTVDINGNVALSGGAINIDEGQEELGAAGGSPNSYFDGNFTMSSGTMTFGTTPVINLGNSSTLVGNTRLTINGNANITGGAINIVTGTSNAEIFLNGATNTFNGVTLASNMQLAFDAASLQTQSLTSDSVLSALQDRDAYNSGNKTNTVTVTDTNTSASGNIGQFSYLIQANTNTATSVLVLGSNLTATAGSGNNLQAANYAYGFTGTLNYVADLQGHTYDMTNTGSTFKPNSPATSNTHSVQADWTLESTTGATGTIKAVAFDLSNSSTTSAYSVVVGSNVNLVSTGGSSTTGVTNNLGYLAGSIDPTSNFIYSGPSTSAAPSTLVSSKTIGGLQVQNGFLNINQAALTAAGAASVTSGGTLALNGSSLGTLTLGTGQNFTLNAATLSLTLTTAGTSDQILGNLGAGSGGAFTITNSTLTLSGTLTINYNDSYTLLADFSSGSVSGLTITGYDSMDYTASLSNTGVLSFMAVPEPSTWVLILGGFAGVLIFRRQTRRELEAAGWVARQPAGQKEVWAGGWQLRSYSDPADSFTLGTPGTLLFSPHGSGIVFFNPGQDSETVTVTKPFSRTVTLAPGAWTESTGEGDHPIPAPTPFPALAAGGK